MDGHTYDPVREIKSFLAEQGLTGYSVGRETNDHGEEYIIVLDGKNWTHMHLASLGHQLAVDAIARHETSS